MHGSWLRITRSHRAVSPSCHEGPPSRRVRCLAVRVPRRTGWTGVRKRRSDAGPRRPRTTPRTRGRPGDERSGGTTEKDRVRRSGGGAGVVTHTPDTAHRTNPLSEGLPCCHGTARRRTQSWGTTATGQVTWWIAACATGPTRGARNGRCRRRPTARSSAPGPSGPWPWSRSPSGQSVPTERRGSGHATDR